MKRHDRQALIAQIEGEATADERALASRLENESEDARRFVREYAMVRSIAGRDRSEAPAEAAIQRAVAIRAAEARGMLDAVGDAVREIVLSLVYDSRIANPALRSHDEGMRSSVRFASENISADLQMELHESRDEWCVRGRLYGLDDPAGRVSVRADSLVAEGRVDASGAFEVNVPRGPCTLWVEAGGRRLKLPGLEIGP